MENFELPSFAQKVFDDYIKDPYSAYDILYKSNSSIKESKKSYFNVTITPEQETEICNMFNDLVATYADEYANSSIKIGETTCNSKEDYVTYANDLISNAFENSEVSLETECKAVSVKVLNGLNQSGSNLFGVYNLILSAILIVGQKHNVHVEKFIKNHESDLIDTHIGAEARGSIKNCKLPNETTDIPDTDTFANADDEKFTQRVNANTRDDMRVNNKEYSAKYNKFTSIYGSLKNKDLDDEAKSFTANLPYTRRKVSSMSDEAEESVKQWEEEGGLNDAKSRIEGHKSRISNPTTNASADDIAFF